jgi:hypothetical protein
VPKLGGQNVYFKQEIMNQAGKYEARRFLSLKEENVLLSCKIE